MQLGFALNLNSNIITKSSKSQILILFYRLITHTANIMFNEQDNNNVATMLTRTIVYIKMIFFMSVFLLNISPVQNLGQPNLEG